MRISMNKTDKILKAAKVFEALAHCENKQAMREVIKKAQAQDHEFEADIIRPFLEGPLEAGYTQTRPLTYQNTPSKFQAPASLSNRDDIIKFQQNLSNYVKQDPNFNFALTKVLGGVPWGTAGKKNDIDGIRGDRTIKAFNFYKQYATKMDPSSDLTIKREQNVDQSLKQLQSLRQKLTVMRSKIAENTKNFTSKSNISPQQVQTAWMPYFKPEFDYLQQAKRNGTLRPEIVTDFDQLSNYMVQLFGSYMTAPPAEPTSSMTL